MKRITKKTKLLLVIALSLILLSCIALTLALNFHRIYVFSETRGWFRQKVKISLTEPDMLREYSIEELSNNQNVTIDQSLMLVNTKFMLPEGFEPEVEEYKSTTVYMNRCMLDAYARLSAAVSERTGKKLYVSSDLRSFEEQEALYKEDPLTATLPGASEHQTGLALDVYVARFSGDGFIRSRSGRFVNSHAHEYGFIIRYPSYGEDITGIRFEPWHIRYVGFPHAGVIYNNHLTLEEYVELLSVGEWYEIDGYLVSRQNAPDGKLSLPESFESCVISPDNTGCYIITVKI